MTPEISAEALPATHAALLERIGPICVALTGETAEAMLASARSALTDCHLLEFRLDHLTAPATALPEIVHFLAEHPEMVAIATCRRSENGGKFGGSLVEELDILTRAAQSGFPILDLELESAEQATPEQLAALRSHGSALIVSYHNFSGMDPLDAVYARVARFQPDFAKIVPTATSLTDSLAMLHFLEATAPKATVVGMCMGQAGVPSRVLGVRSGSTFTFASALTGGETAPGQVPARALVQSFRLPKITRSTRVYGVAGSPTTSSLSPIMLNAAFESEGLDAVYLPLETQHLDDLLELAHRLPLSGFSVTMPHKLGILPYLEHIDPLAARVGAVNTVVRQADGTLHGFNTDIAGIIGPLERRMPLRGARALLLGAGGAARAAAFGLIDRGAQVTIVNRTAATAEALAQESGAATATKEDVHGQHFDVLINATSVGMNGQPTGSWFAPEELNAKLVFDLVYNPLETPLLKQAKARGLQAIAGAEMFVAQGARQFELWTGKTAPRAAMERVVLDELNRRQKV